MGSVGVDSVDLSGTERAEMTTHHLFCDNTKTPGVLQFSITTPELIFVALVTTTTPPVEHRNKLTF